MVKRKRLVNLWLNYKPNKQVDVVLWISITTLNIAVLCLLILLVTGGIQ